MRVRNKKRILFTKGVELDRDMMPGETALVLPEFEQCERILAAISSGAIVITTDKPTGTVKAKSVGGMVVALPPDADLDGDTYYQDRIDTQELPPLVKQAQARADLKAAKEAAKANEKLPDRIVDHGLSHVTARPVDDGQFPKDAIGSQLAREVEEQAQAEVDAEASSEVQEFLRRRGGSRVKYVAEMTDIGAMREALEHVKTGKAKEALRQKIKELTMPRPIDL